MVQAASSEDKKPVISTAIVRSFVSLHVTKNGRDFVFLMPSGTSYQDCHEAFVDGAKKVQELAQEALKRQEEKKEEPKEAK